MSEFTYVKPVDEQKAREQAVSEMRIDQWRRHWESKYWKGAMFPCFSGKIGKQDGLTIRTSTLHKVYLSPCPSDKYVTPLRRIPGGLVGAVILTEAPDIFCSWVVDLGGVDTTYFLKSGWLSSADADEGVAHLIGYPTSCTVIPAGTPLPFSTETLPFKALWCTFSLLDKGEELFRLHDRIKEAYVPPVMEEPIYDEDVMCTVATAVPDPVDPLDDDDREDDLKDTDVPIMLKDLGYWAGIATLSIVAGLILAGVIMLLVATQGAR